MPTRSRDELEDALNRLTSAIRRLEESQAKMIDAMADTVRQLRATEQAILDASKPWWKK